MFPNFPPKKILQNFKKPIDNLIKKCYNKYVTKTNIKRKNEVSVMEKKITKKEYFGMIKAMLDGSGVINESDRENVIAFIDHEVELLNKKSASRSKVDVEKAQVNAQLFEVAYAVLENGKRMTVSEIMKAEPSLAEFSNQKISAVLKVGVDNGTLNKVTEKGKSVFFIA